MYMNQSVLHLLVFSISVFCYKLSGEFVKNRCEENVRDSLFGRREAEVIMGLFGFTRRVVN